MRGVYTASIECAGVTAAKTLLYVTAPANKVLEILGASITNYDNDTNEQAEATLQVVGTLGTPTGTSVTAAKHEPGDQAAGSTVVGNVTGSEPTYSSNTQIGREGFATVGGYRFQPVPEERMIVQGGSTVGLRLLTAISSTALVASVTFREIG